MLTAYILNEMISKNLEIIYIKQRLLHDVQSEEGDKGEEFVAREHKRDSCN